MSDDRQTLYNFSTTSQKRGDGRRCGEKLLVPCGSPRRRGGLGAPIAIGDRRAERQGRLAVPTLNSF
ncbi:MAG: hypothetical protein HYV25_03185 [Candidatus Harrisonbacteria bacterium]|nr:hypothetical protein [Candidatus Harrisonbacteria bacterium]